MDERERITEELIKQLVKMGYPAEFGAAIAKNLRTEKTMSRMIRYLRNANPRSAEEIADEMLAIMEDRDRWVQKKEAEYYNAKYNEMLYNGLGVEDEEEDSLFRN
jgi:hypothetical protein